VLDVTLIVQSIVMVMEVRSVLTKEMVRVDNIIAPKRKCFFCIGRIVLT
jgi:hypothetical protein